MESFLSKSLKIAAVVSAYGILALVTEVELVHSNTQPEAVNLNQTDDDYEETIRDLTQRLKDAENRASEAERVASKLQKEADRLEDELLAEKKKYKKIIDELDQTFAEKAAM